MSFNVSILVFGDFNDQVHKLLNYPKQGKGGHFLMCSGIVVVLYETVNQLKVKPTLDLKLPVLGKVVEVAIKKRIFWCFESSESSI